MYFEELICCYLCHEPYYKNLYSKVWLYTDWAREQGKVRQDTGIDLVAQTHATDEIHAIQCKFYDEKRQISKQDINSFLAASGLKPFSRRLIFSTTDHWTDHAEAMLSGQRIAVIRIGLQGLENSCIDWSKYLPGKKPTLRKRKTLKPHQKNALRDVLDGLGRADRGKLIMACGTGKTFVSLKVAESLAGRGRRVLFLVPSLALLSQALTEWTQESAIPLHSFAVCSDEKIGKKRDRDDDRVQIFIHELRYPATTDSRRLAQEIAKRHDDKHLSVVFATYHSIGVIAEAQREYRLGDFDLVICDEAHRTTGATIPGEEETHFVKVHDNNLIRADKRLYMTATPRLYGDQAQAQAEQDKTILCSMDDENLYGSDLHVLNFSEAVKRSLLVDYKVIVLAVDEAHISRSLQQLLKEDDNQLRVSDAAKIVGCWKALTKEGQDEDWTGDTSPMRRAVAFCQVIDQRAGRSHKVSSKHIAAKFQDVIKSYQDQVETRSKLSCEVEHIDGTMNASEKEGKLSWLKQDPRTGTCRILSNVRCLSEGVDVPALDAVLFLTPRSSQVDVVQSVGRVMRRAEAEGKHCGYVVLPVVIPAGVEPHKALDDNRAYQVVWQVLQALRSHDDRFDAFVNKLDLIGPDKSRMEVIAVTDSVVRKQKPADSKAGAGGNVIGEPPPVDYPPQQAPLAFEAGEVERAIYAKLVKKCGNRLYWEEWTRDIAKIAKTHITRISGIVKNSDNIDEAQAFNEFAAELRDDLNDRITDDEVIEMLAQHLITKPVFDALFEGYEFSAHNPVSKAMQSVLDKLQEHHLNKETETLEQFYASVRLRAKGINKAEGKQKIVVELYDKFFRKAFPRMTERLGIVYTPVELVDFIIHSVNEVLQQEFGQTLGKKGVHILDPFTGTGTFITRLLQSGLVAPKELPRKYQSEIHANEIVLLAYYIAAINIEEAYHNMAKGEYKPFDGICLSDTFQMYEKVDQVDALLPDNSERRNRQKALDIRVIMGNPPYSSGQRSQNDNAQNIDYPSLDRRIAETYAKHTTATLHKFLYDSYIRAIRWGSDRLGKAGVMAYVTNAGWIDSDSADGLRKCLANEFANIYIFHLRGNIRRNAQSKGDAKEGDNIFGSASMVGVSINLFVKNPRAKEQGKIYFHDIGDSLDQATKLERIQELGSITGIATGPGWCRLKPDRNHAWLNQGDPSFQRFPALGDKKDKSAAMIFENYSNGLVTNRDAWCYNASQEALVGNIRATIDFYNAEVDRYKQVASAPPPVDDFVDGDNNGIKWTRALKKALQQEKRLDLSRDGQLITATYRPFTKQWLYYSRRLNEVVGQMPQIFPNTNVENRVICVSISGPGVGFSALMCDALPDLHLLGLDTRCFPLKLYEKTDAAGNDLFVKSRGGGGGVPRYETRDGITDAGLALFRDAWPGENVSKEDVFYYIYGLLHSEDYRKRYKNDLTKKQLPRIPAVKAPKDYRAFAQAGRVLSALHLNYESLKPWPVTINNGKPWPQDLSAETLFRVEKMKFGGNAKSKDKTIIVYNPHITIRDIPELAYDYIVSGKSAVEWVMGCQGVKTDRESGLVNDANRYAIETKGDPAYPLNLLLRIIRVSLETIKITEKLPPLRIPDP